MRFTEKQYKNLKQRKAKLPVSEKERTRRNKIKIATLEHDRIVNIGINWLISNGVLALHIKYYYKVRCAKCHSFFGLVVNKKLGDLPDIIAITRTGTVFAEIKTDNAKLTKGQKEFRDALPECYKYFLFHDENTLKLTLKNLI